MIDDVYIATDLHGAMETLIDEWGVPHIYAGCAEDAFFGQGFNVARDRLWQIDLWRRKGLGRLSEVFGDRFLERDRAARLFLYRGDMTLEWGSYGDMGQNIVTSFVKGINFYIDLVEKGAVQVPVEFSSMGYMPERWQPEDVVRIRTHGVFGNLREEVARAETITNFGARVEDLRKVRTPERSVHFPDDQTLQVVTAEVLRTFDLATKPIDFETDDTLPAARSYYKDGSNNWAISSKKSQTGRPILSNDPHRVASIAPGLRYICHLSCPEFDVIGGGEPCIPGVSIGHNGHIAFGLTTFSLDQEDLFVLKLNPNNWKQYSHHDGWKDLKFEHQLFTSKGGEKHKADLIFSEYGPVIHLDKERGVAFALRAAWLEAGMAPYLKSIDSMLQKNVADFVNALDGWGAPPLNIVYADTVDNIGWKAVGKAPIRLGWDGLVPVPGNGTYEWAGFRSGEEMPQMVNPLAGYVATANEMNVPEAWTKLELGFDWFAPYRRERIGEVLGSVEKISPKISAELQMDWKSVPAERLLKLLKLHIPDEDLWQSRGFDSFVNWDYVLGSESRAACIFEVWYRKYFRVKLRQLALQVYASIDDPESVWPKISPSEDLLADARIDILILDSPCLFLGKNWRTQLRKIAEESMEDAFSFMKRRLGPASDAWAWGKLHTAMMHHPLAAIVPAIGEKTTLGPVSRGGSGDTVGDTAYDADFVQTGGSTFRMVVDVGAWDNSLAMNSPGQSGVIGSPHFSDLFDRWANGNMFPLLYSRERVNAHMERRLVFQPSP